MQHSHFYIVKLGLLGVYIIFLTFAQSLSKNKKKNHIFIIKLSVFFSRENPLLERLRTRKVFIKDQICFYLNYHKFSIKSYVLDVY